MFAYDTLRDVWLPEDEIHVSDFAFKEGTLYFLDSGSGKIFGSGTVQNEDDIEWSAEFVEFTEQILNRKSYSKLFIRAELAAGAYLKIETSCDGSPFKQVYLTHNEQARTINIPLLPVRCDALKLRLSGEGQCIIKAIEREFKAGSET